MQLENEKHAFRFPLHKNDYKGWGVSADEVLTLQQSKNMRVIKMLVFYSNLIDSVTPVDKTLIETLDSLCLDTAQFYLTDKRKCIQITAKSVNKLSGIEKIRTLTGLAKNEIAVFGDDINDIEMLSAYEYSVAMGNAENHVKEKAKYITTDNNNDGIYHAVCNILHLIDGD